MNRTRIDPREWRTDRDGIALAVVVLVVVVLAAVTTTAAIVGGNAWLINRYDERQSVLEGVADAGLAEARARINGDPSVYPDSGYVVLEDSVAVEAADGSVIPGVHRYTYVGPSGATTGQYGVFGSIVVVAEDESGTRVIRRREITQESFAKFAYFTDEEPSHISFGGGDQIFGPVHTNDELKIYSSGATFHGQVSTAKDVQGEQYGDFRQGYAEYAQEIPMPDMADLEAMEAYAGDANLSFTADPAGETGHAHMRIEFVAIDLNGDGDRTDANEGFIRVYTSDDARWLVADIPDDYEGSGNWWNWTPGEGLRNSRNCGHIHDDTLFVPAADHPNTTAPDSWVASVNNAGRRCFLGGADSLWANAEFDADDGTGEWVAWPATVPQAVQDAGRDDGAYLFPISRALNPDYKGVIFVDGPVAVSGVLRGHVTLAATGDIIIVDDLTYATDPGDGDRICTDGDRSNDDILGLFSGGDIMIANNTINAPWRPNPGGSSGNNRRTYDDTSDEFVHATLLTLNVFTVEDYDDGADMTESCESTLWGRGCLYLTGGIVQRTRGAVGTAAGTGNLKRYSYDQCVLSNPPPYFPTTGVFDRSRYYEIDPVGFDIGEVFELLTPNN